MSFTINGIKSKATFDVVNDLKQKSEGSAKPFAGKLSTNQKEKLDQISDTKSDPTKNNPQAIQDSASASIKNALDQVESARSAVATLRDEQAAIIKTSSEGVESSGSSVQTLNKLQEIDTEISRIKNLTYSSGVSPFSSSTQTLGDDAQTSAGVSLSATSSTYSFASSTTGLTSLSASTATDLLTSAETEAFVTNSDANSAQTTANSAQNLGLTESQKSTEKLSDASSKLSFEQAQDLAGKISSELISKFGGPAANEAANGKLLEQTLSSVANLDVGRAAELLT